MLPARRTGRRPGAAARIRRARPRAPSRHADVARTIASSLSSASSALDADLRRTVASASRSGASAMASGGGSGSGPIRSATRSQFALQARASVRRLASVVSALSASKQRTLERGIVEHEVEEARPSLLERELGGDVVEHLDARRKSGLDRVLREDALRERVQCGHRGSVELFERARGPTATTSGRLRVAARSSARRMRSRSSAAAFSVNVTAAISRIGHGAHGDQRHDAVDERLRLARSRARLHEQGVVEIADDRRGGVVVESAAHLSVSASSASSRVRPSRRSRRVRGRRACAATRGSGRACPRASGSA